MEDEGEESWMNVSNQSSIQHELMVKTYLSRCDGESNGGDEDGGAHVDGCVLFVLSD
jgi:hypothetical protein